MASATKLPSAESVLGDLEANKPSLRGSLDAIAIALHSAMRQLGYCCTGTGNGKVETANETLAPAGWNASIDTISFTYSHPNGSQAFIVKFLTLGSKVLVHAAAQDGGTVLSMELDTHDYINPSAPMHDFRAVYADLDGLLTLFCASIACRLVPRLADASNVAAQAVPAGADRLRDDGGHRPHAPLRDRDRDYDPLRVPPTGRRPSPYGPPIPGFPGGYPGQPSPPFGIGGGDVFPMPFGGPMPGAPPGNLIGPNHPGFGPRVRDPYAGNGGNYPAPGGVPPGHPPGARYDPFGPPGVNRPDPDPDVDIPPHGFGGDSYFL